MTDLLPAWALDALRLPVHGRAGSRDRIMDLVRAAPMPARAPLAFGMRRPGVLRMGVGMAAAASLAAVLAGGMRETIVDASRGAVAGGAATVVVLGDSIGGSLRDTLRLVRFVLESPSATRVALAGSFNAWAPAALEREKRSGRWSTVVALRDGRHAYAFVVDDTQRVAGPALATPRLTVVPDTFEGDSL
jgi:hypothetical protein